MSIAHLTPVGGSAEPPKAAPHPSMALDAVKRRIDNQLAELDRAAAVGARLAQLAREAAQHETIACEYVLAGDMKLARVWALKAHTVRHERAQLIEDHYTEADQ